MTRDPEAASAPRRLLAACVDLVLLLPTYCIPFAVLVWRSPGDGRLDRVQAAVERLRPWLEDRRATWALQILPPACRLRWRAPSPGSRIAGIRRADASTGGEPTLRQLLAEELLTLAQAAVVHRINAPHRERLRVEARELQTRMQAAAQALHTGDREEAELTRVELSRRQQRGCVRSMARPALVTALQPLSALLSPRRQTLIERASGIAWVRDR